MVRTIVTPENTHIELDIPIDYVGRQVEVTYLLVDEIRNKPIKKTMGDFWGILSDESANELRSRINESRQEWERDI